MAILIDTSALLAYALPRDNNFDVADKTIQAVRSQTRVVTSAVVSELFYMVTVRRSYKRAIEVTREIRTAFQIATLLESDLILMEDIMTRYQDAEFDYADVSIMAVAERLNITQIMTFDRRDFAMYRPRHCEYLELLP
jgi:predicted nucleic acid-binding protein